VLGNYTDYYGIPFPLSKLDLIAIPDYSAGAMEVPTRLSFRTRCVCCVCVVQL
jgi:aminopeptidase N